MNSQDSCNCFLPVSLSPLTEPPSTHRKSSAQEAIAELAEASRASKPAEAENGATALVWKCGAWVRWADRPAPVTGQADA